MTWYLYLLVLWLSPAFVLGAVFALYISSTHEPASAQELDDHFAIYWWVKSAEQIERTA